MMLVWVIYDISSDRIRNQVARQCKNAGLYRVQKSVFLGTIEENDFDELKLRVEDIIDSETDSVYIFPMSKSELKKAGLIGQAFDKELVSDEIISKFF
jgi:CRISPR-associated protein Cas2